MRFFVFAFLAMVFCLSAQEITIPKKGTIAYAKYESAWFFENEGDLEKPAKDVKGKKVLYFGNKVTIVGSKKIGDKYFLNAQLPDKSKIWGNIDYFTTKFIIITGENIPTFTQPDESFLGKAVLQTGYLGYIVKEVDGFINVDFNHYTIPTDDKKTLWIGNVWMKNTAYTDDIKTAAQANTLKTAINFIYGKQPDTKSAVKKLKEGLTLNNSEETPVTGTIKALIEKFDTQEKVAANKPELVAGNYYTTTYDNLRFRESEGAGGKFIRMLKAGEKLKLLDVGTSETINDVAGNWCKFEDETGIIGWAFDAYLINAK